MSDENTARHAECTVEFDGVDITSSIKPYLLSLTFTDNEEDASDDLQIKLQDREGVWMTDWLRRCWTAMCRPHLLMATRLVTWCSFSVVRTTRHLPTKGKRNTKGWPGQDHHHQTGCAAPVPCYSHGRNVPGLWLGRCQRDLR